MAKKALTSETGVAEDKALWRQLSLSALCPQPAPKAGAKKKPRRRQLPRIAALKYLKAIEKTVLELTGKTLAEFVASAEDLESLGDPKPTLVTCIDQGSDGWSLMWWLAYSQKLRLVFKNDPFHREWNDIMGAIKAAGCWGDCVLTSMV